MSTSADQSLRAYWLPKLKSHASTCRRADRARYSGNLDRQSAQQQQVFSRMMDRYAVNDAGTESLAGIEDDRSLIIVTSPIGILTFEQRFGKSHRDAILLLPEEHDEWFTRQYEWDNQRTWWFVTFRFTFAQDVRESPASLTDRGQLATTTQKWLSCQSVQWSDLAGESISHLWEWTGDHFHYLRIEAVESF
jgi:hypothetical protein